MTVSFSSKAIKYIEREVENLNSNSETKGFRILIKAGGCHGFLYVYGAVKNKQENDFVLVANSTKVYIDSNGMKLLAGTYVDKSENMLDGALTFHNPQAKSSCGCGNSFELDAK